VLAIWSNEIDVMSGVIKVDGEDVGLGQDVQAREDVEGSCTVDQPFLHATDWSSGV
jgi:hypothetical protein